MDLSDQWLHTRLCPRFITRKRDRHRARWPSDNQQYSQQSGSLLRRRHSVCVPDFPAGAAVVDGALSLKGSALSRPIYFRTIQRSSLQSIACRLPCLRRAFHAMSYRFSIFLLAFVVATLTISAAETR